MSRRSLERFCTHDFPAGLVRRGVCSWTSRFESRRTYGQKTLRSNTVRLDATTARGRAASRVAETFWLGAGRQSGPRPRRVPHTSTLKSPSASGGPPLENRGEVIGRGGYITCSGLISRKLTFRFATSLRHYCLPHIGRKC